MKYHRESDPVEYPTTLGVIQSLYTKPDPVGEIGSIISVDITVSYSQARSMMIGLARDTSSVPDRAFRPGVLAL
jgi:hypothetical protein